MAETNINEKIMKKLEKFSQNPAELNMCKELLSRELRWFNIDDPPFKRDFSKVLTQYFPFEDDQNV